MKNFKLWAALLLAGILTACGGGGGGCDDALTGNCNATGGGGTSEIATLQVITSSPLLLTDQSGTEFVTISAVARDANNNVVGGEDLIFRATSGSVEEVNGGITNASGIAEAFLKSFGNVTNRQITVTVEAPAAGVTGSVVINVTGTVLQVSGPNAIADSDPARYSFTLKDGKGVGISGEAIVLTSSSGSFNNSAPQTGASGEAQATLTGATPGANTITAEVLGISQDITLNVSNDVFAFTSPAAGTEVAIEPSSTTIDIVWQQNGVNVPDGSTIEFTADRGGLSSGSATTTSGVASIDISSFSAGLSTITATGISLGATPLADGPTTQLTIEFVADTPSVINVGAFPTVLVAGEQATITAVVKDAAFNRVKNIDVDFRIVSDSSLGQLTVSSDKTDSQGVATTIYTAGNSTTDENGVVIEARVRGTGIIETTALTVAGQSIDFVIGTGNDIFEPSPTRFGIQWTITATDVTGAPVAGKQVRIGVRSTHYRKGNLVRDVLAGSWRLPSGPTPANGGPAPGDPEFLDVCFDEDWIGNGIGNNNGILEPAEDFNGSLAWEAGNVATIVATTCDQVAAADPGATQQALTTDSSGSVEVCLVYPQDHGLWVDVVLTAAMAIEGGSEDIGTRAFGLWAKADDLNNIQASPPGVESPFGDNYCDQPN